MGAQSDTEVWASTHRGRAQSHRAIEPRTYGKHTNIPPTTIERKERHGRGQSASRSKHAPATTEQQAYLRYTILHLSSHTHGSRGDTFKNEGAKTQFWRPSKRTFLGSTFEGLKNANITYNNKCSSMRNFVPLNHRARGDFQAENLHYDTRSNNNQAKHEERTIQQNQAHRKKGMSKGQKE